MSASSPFVGEVRRALRGGGILLVGALVGVLVFEGRKGSFFVPFLWLFWAWLVFPLGALLGCGLPRWATGRGSLAGFGLGLLVSVLAGLVLGASFWLCANHQDLIGLVTNAKGGGYASYSFSVRSHLRQEAWRALTGLAPVMALWVVLWWGWTSTWARPAPSAAAQGNPAGPVCLRLDRHLARLVGWVMAGIALLATASLVFTALAHRVRHGDLGPLFLAAPMGAGLVVLGPWLGVLINPGGGSSVAWHLTLVTLPVLLSGLAPFVLRRRPVRPVTAALAWCWFVTALLFWVAGGAFSLGWSLG